MTQKISAHIRMRVRRARAHRRDVHTHPSSRARDTTPTRAHDSRRRRRRHRRPFRARVTRLRADDDSKDASYIFFPSQIAYHVRTSCTVEREAIDVARAKSTHAFRSAARMNVRANECAIGAPIVRDGVWCVPVRRRRWVFGCSIHRIARIASSSHACRDDDDDDDDDDDARQRMDY